MSRNHLLLIVALFFQTLVFCQNGAEQGIASAFQSPAGNFPTFEKSQATATNIVFKSTDGGQTWQDISAGLPKEISVMNVLVRGNEINVASELGLFQYNTTFIPPITPTWEKETALKEKIYSIFPGPNGMYIGSYYNGFFQEVQGTDFWIPKFQNLKEKLVHTLLETEEGVLFVGSDNGIFKSSDAGETWKGVFVESSIKSIFLEGNVLVASSSKGLLRSTDKGEHWNWVLTNSGSIIKTRPIKGGFVAVTQSVESRNEIGLETIKNDLFFSFDQGKTWQEIKGSLEFENIFDMEQAGDYLYCSHKNGISRSSDRGKTWELVHPPFSERNWAMLAVSGNVIFVVMFAGC